MHEGGRHWTIVVGVFLAVGFAVISGAAPSTASADCKPYIFVGARGSGQDDAAGASGMGDVVGFSYNTVAALLPNTVEAEPLRTADGYRAAPVYTRTDLVELGAAATLGGPAGFSIAGIIGNSRYSSYSDSVHDGKQGLSAVLHRLASDCPSSKVLLAGYSQGAHVVQDTMQSADATLRSHVLGVATFGDPRFNPAGRGTLGTFDVRRHGLLGSRPADSPVRAESFCISGDPVCQGFIYASLTGLPHGFSVSAHFSYIVDGWAEQAGRWMYQLIRKDIASSGGVVPPEPAPAPRPLDLSLVVDTTGSMGGAINSVRTNLQAIRDELAAKTTDFRLALTEFKDFGDAFQSQLDMDFTADADAFSTAVGGLSAGGGGDTPESVYSGLQTGLTVVSWRPDVAKAVVLVGDAPPHDPETGTNLTESDIVTEALRVPAPIFALNICCDPETAEAFGRLASDTSGELLSPDNGAAVADSILEAIAAQSKTPIIGSSAATGGPTIAPTRARRAIMSEGATETTMPVGTEISFSAGTASSPLGQDLSYTWDFGDGTIQNADSDRTVVSHIYAAPFDGDIRLTATDQDGRSAQALFAVSVHGDPVPAPAGLTAPSLTAEDGAVSATWAPPAIGQPAYYELQREGQTVVSVLAGQPLGARLDGLTNGNALNLSVVAYDAYGRSVMSPNASVSPTALGTALPPTPEASSQPGGGVLASFAQGGLDSRTATRPNISRASQSHAIWREGKSLATISRNSARSSSIGTTISFTLDQAANVHFAFTQPVGGRRIKGRCAVQTKTSRYGSPCKRHVARGTMSFAGHSGVNTLVFEGLIARSKKLPLGRYALLITATNAASQHSAARSLHFTIVR
jgi:hypothetical protein